MKNVDRQFMIRVMEIARDEYEALVKREENDRLRADFEKSLKESQSIIDAAERGESIIIGGL